MHIVKIIAFILLGILVVLSGYVAYVFIAYYRLPDTMSLDVEDSVSGPVQLNTDYTITTYNLGFGAYSSDYSFFMDGGKYARAYNRDAVLSNIGGAVSKMTAVNPDFALFQEVDVRATRSHHVDETALLKKSFPAYASVFAQNYDSPYLFYPLHQPIGKSLSGVMAFSKFSVTDALRRSLPIETGFSKLIDLDRCYQILRVPVIDGRQLVIFNVHLSAYTTDVTIGETQLTMLFEDAGREFEAGNFVIIGGDFNKDIHGDSPQLFNTKTDVKNWAKPMNTTLIPDGFTAIRPENSADIHPTTRDCDTGYVEGVSFVSAVDGFIISDNVIPVHTETIDTGFLYSDHNPVLLRFNLAQVCTGGACGKYAG